MTTTTNLDRYVEPSDGRIDWAELSSGLVASGGWAKVPRDKAGKWTSVGSGGGGIITDPHEDTTLQKVITSHAKEKLATGQVDGGFTWITDQGTVSTVTGVNPLDGTFDVVSNTVSVLLGDEDPYVSQALTGVSYNKAIITAAWQPKPQATGEEWAPKAEAGLLPTGTKILQPNGNEVTVWHSVAGQYDITIQNGSGVTDNPLVSHGELASTLNQPGVLVFPPVAGAAEALASAKTAAGGVTAPKNWATMTPGQKAAWTKKNGKPTSFPPPEPPKPALMPYKKGETQLPPGAVIEYTTKSGKVVQGTVTSHSIGGSVQVSFGDGKSGYAGKDSVLGIVSMPEAKPSAPSVASVVAPTKPADWASWSPGKKAAWTKKNGGPNSQLIASAAKPPNWSSMSPGEKAAWTKKQGASASVTKLKKGSGEHSITTYTAATRGQAWSKFRSSRGTIGANDKATFAPALERVKTVQDTEARAAWGDYIGSGYIAMNGSLRGKQAMTSSMAQRINAFDRVFQTSAAEGPRPSTMIRGVSTNGEMRELTYQLGQEFVEPKYSSYSVSVSTASSGLFGGAGKSAPTSSRVMVRLINADKARSVAGNGGESEFVIARGTRFRVVGIEDQVVETSLGSSTYRMLTVEPVPGPLPPPLPVP